MARPAPLPVWDRQHQRLFEEFSDDLQSTYETHPRHSPTAWLEARRWYDWIVSAAQNSSWSARKVQPFIDKHKIDMSEFEPVIYRSYAQFFTRKFRAGVRRFPSNANDMGAFAEARYFGWEKFEPDQRFPIKGQSINADLILGDKERARQFIGGPILVARLSPVDYHHVHYFDDGQTVADRHIGGSLWTVHWKALQNKDNILFVNERYVSILDTKRFGTVGFVEIGAMTVGRIVQVHPLDCSFERGSEKSFFCFGGSAIVVFGEPGRWRPADDILKHTREGTETLVRLGDVIATATSVETNFPRIA